MFGRKLVGRLFGSRSSKTSKQSTAVTDGGNMTSNPFANEITDEDSYKMNHKRRGKAVVIANLPRWVIELDLEKKQERDAPKKPATDLENKDATDQEKMVVMDPGQERDDLEKTALFDVTDLEKKGATGQEQMVVSDPQQDRTDLKKTAMPGVTGLEKKGAATDEAQTIVMDPEQEKAGLKKTAMSEVTDLENKIELEEIANLEKTILSANLQMVEQMLAELQFLKVEVFKNLDEKKLKSTLQKIAEDDHTEADCFMCVVLAHGSLNPKTFPHGSRQIYDYINTTKGMLFVDKIVQQFTVARSSPSLAGKPKFFFVLACRGGLLAGKVKVTELQSTQRVTGAEAVSHRRHLNKPGGQKQYFDYGLPYNVPVYKDMFLAYSTTPGFASLFEPEGCPFLQKVSARISKDRIDKDGHPVDFATLIARAQADVAVDHESKKIEIGSTSYDKEKQMPWVASMLTKDVYFMNKLDLGAD